MSRLRVNETRPRRARCDGIQRRFVSVIQRDPSIRRWSDARQIMQRFRSWGVSRTATLMCVGRYVEVPHLPDIRPRRLPWTDHSIEHIVREKRVRCLCWHFNVTKVFNFLTGFSLPPASVAAPPIHIRPDFHYGEYIFYIYLRF